MLVVHIANMLFCFCVVFSANLTHVDIYTLFLNGASLSAGSASLGATFLHRAMRYSEKMNRTINWTIAHDMLQH